MGDRDYQKKELSELIKNTAKNSGFDFCGISEAVFLKEEAPRLENWLKKGFQGKMNYMQNHFDKRLDPALLVPGAKSVISLMYNYYPAKDLGNTNDLKISKYAYGHDYHDIIRNKLKNLVLELEKKLGKIEGRVFVDSAPVLERAWAAKSGLGWIGKNSLLINKKSGSFFFLAQIISDLNPLPDLPIRDYCGTCTACIDACPTNAIVENKIIDSNKCISYLTIELKDEIPAGYSGKTENWVFGCDICQDVCPWNRFSKPHHEPEFTPLNGIENWNKKDWEEMTEDVFNKSFVNSPIKRTGFNGMKRNLKLL